MITCQSIKGAGAGYMERHLSANDYWSEGETVAGKWFGKGAEMLGVLTGSPVTSDQFAALGSNRHPITGDKLTAVDSADRKAWTDIQLSAPKDVSVLALVGGDERVREAFHLSVQTALEELQAFAGARERRGSLNTSEEVRETGNIAAAVYHHDASRALDPQLHDHAVVANATWDAETGRWLALQSRDMLRASVYARQVLYSDLADRLESLGYQVHNRTDTGFEVKGLEHLRERFSRRDAAVEELAQQWEKDHGHPPTKKEREILVRESRDRKLTEITTPEVRAAQNALLTPAEKQALAGLVAQATGATAKPRQSATPTQDLDAALVGGLAHVHERASVGRQWDILAAAMAHAPSGAILDGRALRERLVARATGEAPDLHAAPGWRVTTAAVAAEERKTVDLALAGRDTLPTPLASAEALDKQTGPVALSHEQKAAAKTLAASRDATTVLVGDAGTGKTTLLQAVQAASDNSWIALGPTTRARDELNANGFKADTVAKFLASKKLQAVAPGTVILVDEAGTLSMPQLRQLQEIAVHQKCRLLLVGDTKQHQAVERGDALRAVLDRASDHGSGLKVARLQTVRRQRIEEHREIAGLIAGGNVLDALQKQKSLGIVQEVKNERDLVSVAADHYTARRQALAAAATSSKQKPGEILGIAPLWQDAEKFSAAVRLRLRASGQLQGEDRAASVIEPLGWTREEVKVAARYRPGEHVLTFARKQESVGAKSGENWLVESISKEGLHIRQLDNSTSKTDQRHKSPSTSKLVPWSGLAHASVGNLRKIKLAAGDSILLRANCRQGKNTVAANGQVRRVQSIGKDGRIHLVGGGILPASFKHYQHGYAVTSHKSQGASVEEAVVVMGADACRMANRRQWYVSSTRHKQDAKIFATDLGAIATALQRDTAAGRELVAETPHPRAATPRKPATPIVPAATPPEVQAPLANPGNQSLFGSSLSRHAAKLARQAIVAATNAGKVILKGRTPAKEQSPSPSTKRRGLELGL